MKLCEIIHGSHLYGLNTPDSDIDKKGVFLPDRKDILLQRASKSVKSSTGNDTSKNGAGDEDFEFYSLHYFIQLALKGEMIAFDMLHAPVQSCESVWRELVANRSWFYTKDVRSYIGYARKQVAKYGQKGSRLANLRQVIDVVDRLLYSVPSVKNEKLSEIIDYLPNDEFVFPIGDEHGNRYYEVLGSKHQDTTKVEHFINRIRNTYNKYGHRAKKAEKNEGVDWKAVSHSFRACYQLIQLYTQGTMTFPIPNREEVLSVKLGEKDYKGYVEPKLNDLMEQVEELAKNSNFPDKPDRKSAENFVANVYYDYLRS
ncbi:MAG: hypothetical protein CL489_08235 [Acidobacteria bacterium]|nr:hypothetical protein [Acidobacteriota bacterium]|tara:strand:+ start:7775 stop:8716 length:942 start_codon:yes stop_codon:yes gene_type:complete